MRVLCYFLFCNWILHSKLTKNFFLWNINSKTMQGFIRYWYSLQSLFLFVLQCHLSGNSGKRNNCSLCSCCPNWFAIAYEGTGTGEWIYIIFPSFKIYQSYDFHVQGSLIPLLPLKRILEISTLLQAFRLAQHVVVKIKALFLLEKEKKKKKGDFRFVKRIKFEIILQICSIPELSTVLNAVFEKMKFWIVSGWNFRRTFL